MQSFFECPEDANEITKNHTLAVSGEFCAISLFLRKKELRDVLIAEV